MVSELIYHSNRRWKRNKLEEIFFPREMEFILAKKLAVDEDDFWVWDHDKNRSFSVKSRYWLANKIKNDVLIQEVKALPSLNIIMERIWDLQYSLKRKFVFRAINMGPFQ